MWTSPLPRRPFLSASLGILALLGAVSTSTAADNQPNIVLLIGDDHGWDETGYNGHPHLQTPVLDDMAASGLRFDHFHSAHPSCSPTRGSVITGRHPVRYGTFAPNWSLRPQEVGVAQVLGKAGYATAHFGKWHLGPVKADSPTNPGATGFDEWLSHDNFFEIDPILSHNGAPPEKYTGESSAVIVEQATLFIEKANARNQPYFVVICFGSPHEPYSGLEKDLALYANLPARYRNQTFNLTSNETGLPTTRPLNEVLQERYAEITAMDRSIGHLRRWLDNQNLRENTLLWYFSDNGSPADGAVTSPLRGHKAQMYQGGLRVPAVLEWPAKIAHPRITQLNTVTSDILPTLCDLLNLPLPNRPLDGISLKPLLLDDALTSRPHPIGFWEYNIPQLMARHPEPFINPDLQKGTTPLVKQMDGQYTRSFQNVRFDEITPQDFEGPRAFLDNRYKLIIGARREGKQEQKELFDLQSDPAEKHNIIDEKPAIARKLEQQLQDWQQSVLNSLTGADYR